jgi:hypothetical protein
VQPELGEKVDALIRLFASTDLIDAATIQEKRRSAMAIIAQRMIDDGAAYNQASEGPTFFSQGEASFRAFMKSADQDIAWQCETISGSFERYLKIGEIPAPHYPMRLAVLLRKSHDSEREKQFLSQWCRHFPTGNGVTYAKLDERAKKVGAI